MNDGMDKNWSVENTSIRISVIIPTFNRAHLLKKAIESVVRQTYKHWEAIVIDNHSCDETDEVVKSFEDHRISIFKIHNHGIIAASRNLGIQKAKGAFVTFLDSDDIWYPGRLEAVASMIHASTCYDVICTNEMMVEVETGFTRTLRYGPHENNFYETLLVKGNRLSTSATAIKKSFLTQYGLGFGEFQNYVTVEDYDLWLNLARCGARFYFVDEIHGEYLIHSQNASGRAELHWQNMEKLLWNHVFRVQTFCSAPEKLWEKILPRIRFGQGLVCFKQANYIKAVKIWGEVFFSIPVQSARWCVWRLKQKADERYGNVS